MSRKKTPAQLDREIAQALKPQSQRRHHATVKDLWDVAMDAIMEGDAKRAAKIAKEARQQGRPTDAFLSALHKAPRAVLAKYLTLVENKKLTGSKKAVDFFKKHAGAKARGARRLADAEAEAEERGWKVDWEDDPEEWQGDDERPFEVLTAVLRDGEGNVLDSLGGIGMTGNRLEDQNYGRVVEAELAVEALARF